MITAQDLEMAALAAGKRVAAGYVTAHDNLTAIVLESGEEWRPHTDIADAARLAVRHRFWVRVDHAAAEVIDVDGAIIALVPHDDTDEDAERAYCEAVTLGAAHDGRWIRDNRAEIGQRMQESSR